jgi:hypothetical protein
MYKTILNLEPQAHTMELKSRLGYIQLDDESLRELGQKLPLVIQPLKAPKEGFVLDQAFASEAGYITNLEKSSKTTSGRSLDSVLRHVWVTFKVNGIESRSNVVQRFVRWSNEKSPMQIVRLLANY